MTGPGARPSAIECVEMTCGPWPDLGAIHLAGVDQRRAAAVSEVVDDEPFGAVLVGDKRVQYPQVEAFSQPLGDDGGKKAVLRNQAAEPALAALVAQAADAHNMPQREARTGQDSRKVEGSHSPWAPDCLQRRTAPQDHLREALERQLLATHDRDDVGGQGRVVGRAERKFRPDRACGVQLLRMRVRGGDRSQQFALGPGRHRAVGQKRRHRRDRDAIPLDRGVAANIVGRLRLLSGRVGLAAAL